jgi:hypothetical protein
MKDSFTISNLGFGIWSQDIWKPNLKQEKYISLWSENIWYVWSISPTDLRYFKKSIILESVRCTKLKFLFTLG